MKRELQMTSFVDYTKKLTGAADCFSCGKKIPMVYGSTNNMAKLLAMRNRCLNLTNMTRRST
jgi:hypothetical protein